MKKIVFAAVLIGGGWFLYTYIGVYALIAWIAVCLAFAFMVKKLFLREAGAIAVFVVVYTLVLFGGGVLLANNWSEAAAGVWVGFWIIWLTLFRKKIIGKISPTLRMEKLFHEVMKEKTGQVTKQRDEQEK